VVTLQSDSAHFQNQTDHCNSASCPVLSCTVYTILSCPVLSCICPVLFCNVVCSCIFEWWQSAYGENERIILSDFHQELTFRGGPVRIIPWIGRYPSGAIQTPTVIRVQCRAAAVLQRRSQLINKHRRDERLTAVNLTACHPITTEHRIQWSPPQHWPLRLSSWAERLM